MSEETPKRVISLAPKLTIYESENEKTYRSEWRWNIKVNGKIIASSSEGYVNRLDCINNILNVEKRIKYLREKDMIK